MKWGGVLPVVWLPPTDPPHQPQLYVSSQVIHLTSRFVNCPQVSGYCAFLPLPGSFHGWDMSGLHKCYFTQLWTCCCLAHLCYNLLGLPLRFYLPRCYRTSKIRVRSWPNMRHAPAYFSEVPGAEFSPRPLCTAPLWSGRSCVCRHLGEWISLPAVCLCSLPVLPGSSSFCSVNKTFESCCCQKAPPNSITQILHVKEVVPC